MRLPLLTLLAVLLALRVLPPPPPPWIPEPKVPMETLPVPGGVREFRIHRAPRPAGPQPLVVMLHGRGDSAPNLQSTTGWDAVADLEGFTVVYPQGSGQPRTFDIGFGSEEETADVAFLRALVDEVPRRWPIDRSRIYVCGFSSGGMMAARMAAAMPERLGGVGIVAGTVGVVRGGRAAMVPRPDRPIPVAIVHGVQDERVPYLGGGWRNFLSVADAVHFYLAANAAEGLPRVDREGAVTRQIWTGPSPRSAVLLLRLEGWGHQWPEGRPGQPLSAPRELWRFFRQYQAVSPPGEGAPALR